MSVRLDQWLWATRFYKTRTLAVTAIKSGKILVNQQRVKPARHVSVNDQLEISRQRELFRITVLGLIDKRVSAKIAQQQYAEDEASRQQRLEKSKVRAFEYRGARPPSGRPSGKDRGRIRRFRGKD